MIDRSGTVYAYIEALDAAVESEIRMAATSHGHKILFIRHNAADIRITTYDLELTHSRETPPMQHALHWGVVKYTPKASSA